MVLIATGKRSHTKQHKLENETTMVSMSREDSKHVVA